MDLIVGVADMKVTKNPDAALVTYSLGSCVGVCIFDPVARVGGLLHYMLPESSLDAVKAKNNPFMFGDTGIPLLFRESYRLGAQKNRLKVIVAGGARILDQNGLFDIGRRNYIMLRKLLRKNNIPIDFEDVGGNINRTIKLEINNGNAWIKASGAGVRQIW